MHCGKTLFPLCFPAEEALIKRTLQIQMRLNEPRLNPDKLLSRKTFGVIDFTIKKIKTGGGNTSKHLLHAKLSSGNDLLHLVVLVG